MNDFWCFGCTIINLSFHCSILFITEKISIAIISPIWNAGYKGITQLSDFMHVSGFERVHWVLTQSHLLRHGKVKNHDTKRTVPTSMSRSRISCERLTEWFLWYVTSSLRELNLTTQRKNLPCVSRSTLKCCTSPPHLQLQRNIRKNPGKWWKYSKSNGK